jgi:hypothetical protein
MHETTKLNIAKMNEKYRIAASKGHKEVKLEPGDLVWLHLRKERFPELRKSKLMSKLMAAFLLRSMIMHINLSCLPSSRLVPALTFQICDLTWERKIPSPYHTITSTTIISLGKLVLMLLRL